MNETSLNPIHILLLWSLREKWGRNITVLLTSVLGHQLLGFIVLTLQKSAKILKNLYIENFLQYVRDLSIFK